MLGKALRLPRRYENDEFDADFFDRPDAANGASRLLIIGECTELNLFVGTAMNEAHQDMELTSDLIMRMNLVGQFIAVVKKMGKQVTVKYY